MAKNQQDLLYDSFDLLLRYVPTFPEASVVLTQIRRDKVKSMLIGVDLLHLQYALVID